MKRILFTLATLTVWLTAAAQLQVTELKLKNGMTVWLNEDHSQPKVFGAVVVRAGAKDSPNTGIAHYFEHIMFKGTDRLGTIDYQAEKPWLDSISAQYDLLSQTRDEAGRTAIQKHINELSLKAANYMIPNEFNRLISKYGGSALNAGTGHDMTYYHNSFLPQYIAQWCRLNAERLINPVFRGFQGELENVYEEKNRSADNMVRSAMDKAFEAVFKTQPYAYPILGSTESLKNPRLSDMEAFYRKYYVAPNMGLILSGDITPDSTLTALLEQTFGRVPTGPVPERGKSPLPPIADDERYEVRLPIPLIGAEAMVFKAPTDYEPDAAALTLANKLLSNGKAGRLDSLMNEHRVMLALSLNTSLNDAGVSAVIIIPKLLGKMKTAEGRVMEQIEEVMEGHFDDRQLEALKQEMVLEAEQRLETIDSRSQLLVAAFSAGIGWQQVLDRLQAIKRLTKADVVTAAKKYYGANHITLVKKYGIDDKEALRQPGYKPISPKNADAKSALALELEQMPVSKRDIRCVDFDNDITIRPLNSHVTLYYKENPVNDIFTFTLRYKDGQLHSPRLALLADYLETIGTDSLAKQQLERTWQQLGTTMETEVADKTFSISLTGPDSQLQPALGLLAHFLRAAKGDDEALSDVKDADKIDRKRFGKQKDDVLRPMLHRIAYGSRSQYLTQLSKKEIKALKSEELLNLFRELQQYDCELFYCGRQPAERVAQVSLQSLPLAQCQQPQADTYRELQQYQEPTVFFYDVPKSRQNYVISYETVGALPTAGQRVVMSLWSEYFGGGMSSVLFQNVREFRSLAYSTGGSTIRPSLMQHPDGTVAYFTATGTQADKTLECVATIDSLLRQMPMKEENLESARQAILSDIQNDFPTFRKLGQYVAGQRMNGYTSDANATAARLLPSVSAADVEQFYRQHISSQPNRVWVIVGDKKQTDLSALARYGRVVQLKREDIYR